MAKQGNKTQLKIHNRDLLLQSDSDLHMFESQCDKGFRHLWLVIPHFPKNNQFPLNTAEIITHHKGLQKVWRKETFIPQYGARLPLYVQGQYFVMPLVGKSERASLSFEGGWLTITVE